MKERNLNKMLPCTHLSTCISTCKKGIYEEFMMEAKRGIIYHMQAFDDNSLQYINYSYLKIVKGSA